MLLCYGQVLTMRARWPAATPLTSQQTVAEHTAHTQQAAEAMPADTIAPADITSVIKLPVSLLGSSHPHARQISSSFIGSLTLSGDTSELCQILHDLGAAEPGFKLLESPSEHVDTHEAMLRMFLELRRHQQLQCESFLEAGLQQHLARFITAPGAFTSPTPVFPSVEYMTLLTSRYCVTREDHQ